MKGDKNVIGLLLSGTGEKGGLVKTIQCLLVPFYCLDPAPFDFCLFPEVKMTMEDKHFELTQDIKAGRTASLNTFTKGDF